MMAAEGVHKGHRGRMKEKLLAFGERIFNTYELLEMLLYYVIPYRDTNPISKALLKRFSGIDGVLSADYEELLSVEGVGPKAAELIFSVGRINLHDASDTGARVSFSDNMTAGRYFVDLFRDIKTPAVYLALLDNKAHLIDTVKISDTDYSSGRVRSELFVDEMLKSGASFGIIGHNHPYGALIPSEGDIATNAMIMRDTRAAGTPIAEHFIVSGDSFYGFINNVRGEAQRGESEAPTAKNEAADCHGELRKLLLEYSSSDADTLDSFLKKYNTNSKLSCVGDTEILNHLNGDMSTFVFIKLLFSLNSRRITDSFKVGKVYSQSELERYLSALFLPLSVESLYLVSLDKEGRVLATDLVSEGSVGALGIVPRRLLDTAVRRRASSVIIAHNHPGGYAIPSAEDKEGTEIIKNAFLSSGINFAAHYVVAGDSVEIV